MGRRTNLILPARNAPDPAWHARWRERFRRQGYPPAVVERKFATLLAARESWEVKK